MSLFTYPQRRHSADRMCLAVLVSLPFVGAPSITAEELKWQTTPGARLVELPVAVERKAGFTAQPAAATGILFTNIISDERSMANRNLLSGSGVALGDVDGDGLCDIYFCRLEGDNVLYRNRGNWKFEDITQAAGVACSNEDSMGASFADVDGDGDLDLLVNSLGGGTRIFQNDGKGYFKEITDQAGVRSRTGSTSLALADIDGDADLDLYVANFRPTTIKDQPTTRFSGNMIDGRPVIIAVDGRPTTLPEFTNRFELSPSGEVLEYGEADVLYLNDGKGRFTPVSFTDGSFLNEDGNPLQQPPRDWGLAVQFHDFTGDGAPDLYVCNDLFTPDRIWINDGRGRFRALPRLALRNTSTFSMGVDFGDLDRDGNVDFFVVDMLSRNHKDRQVQVAGSGARAFPVGLIDNRPQFLRNTLQISRGDGTYAEIAYYGGVEASEWSWGPIFLDVDLDGYEDILITNGQLRDFQNADIADQIERAQAANRFSSSERSKLMKEFPGLFTPNVVFRNRGDLSFEDVSAAWGFDTVGVSQGMALGDLDNDGDLDVVVNNLNGEAGVYRNEGSAPRVAVRLKGSGGNTRGIGAKIRVYGGAVAMQSQEMICGGRYLSSDEAMRVFAAGSLTNEMRIEVSWRSGKRSVVSGVKGNRLYEIEEAGAPEKGAEKKQEEIKAVFSDVSQRLGHRHMEELYEDFARQPLLPRKLSQLGPGAGWADLDGDGWEELIIGSGRGGKLAVFQNEGQGGFKALKDPAVDKVVTRDQTSVVANEGLILVGSSNYEDGLTNGGCVRVYDLKRHTSGESVLGQAFSVGPLALGDIDQDGDLDLFVGGRSLPGKYPEGVPSLLLRNDAGKLVVVESWDKTGMVSGAVFSDLDGDGDPDLVLACEWGPVRVYRNEGSKYLEITDQTGLSQYLGWWNGVATGDFDEDGRLDIVASNWGENTRYRTSAEHPRQLYYGDLDGNGSVEDIETHYEPGMKAEVPDRGLRAVGAALPWVREKWTTYEAYGKASVREIYGEKLTRSVSVNTLASTLFLNRGEGKWEARRLPAEAQWAPGYAVCVGDYDGDGHEDVFLSQNFFAVTPDDARADAGRGLWLRGDGKGNLSPVSGQESGVKVYGEQRGAALCDYDHDGRVDLVVTQNGAESKLYHNEGARPGLRVRLKGPAGNASGVGAQLRLSYGNGKAGPVREVQAGSGYWSQNSATQVLGLRETPTQLQIRWAGGKTSRVDLQTGAREIEINRDDTVRVIR